MRVSRPLVLTTLVPCLAIAIGAPVASGAAATPQQQLAAAARSFAKLRSYHVTEKDTDKDGTSSITADVTTSGRTDVRLGLGKGVTLQFRKIGSSTYLRGNAAYWKTVSGRADGATLAKKLGGRWLRADAADAKSVADLFDGFAPKKLAACLVAPESTGTLSAGAPATVGGKKATVIVDAGDRPGVAPGKLFLSTDSRTLPLRVLQTGKGTPGGKETACTDPSDTSTSSDARFSRFNERLSIPTPKHALKAPSTGSGSGSPTGPLV